MKDFRLKDGDIAVKNGDFEMVKDSEELRQSVYIGMQTNEEEWFLNPDLGMNFSVFSTKPINEEAIRAEIMKGIFQDERIRTVDEIDITPDTKKRVLQVRFTATATDGSTIESEVDISA